jgi:hypothetical protein
VRRPYETRCDVSLSWSMTVPHDLPAPGEYAAYGGYAQCCTPTRIEVDAFSSR